MKYKTKHKTELLTFLENNQDRHLTIQEIQKALKSIPQATLYRLIDSLVENGQVKKYFIDPTQYDLVIGYRADDAYFRFPLDFVRGNITLEQLGASFELGQLGIQYAVMSEKCINKLSYKESILSNQKFINRYFEQVIRATERYDNLSKDEEGTRIFDIMRAL